MRYLVHAALIVSLLGACTDRGGDAVTDTGLVTDADGDGVPASEDCDDDPSGCGADCFPGNPAADTCDGYDNDCDDATDEDVDGTFYADCDGDGAFAATAVTACDADSAASPCADGAAPDGGFTATAPTTADCDDEDALANLEDLDGDGVSTCDGDCDDDPSGCGEDCFPGNSEPDTCDNADVDCDGLIGNDNGDDWYADCDGDADFAEEPVQSCGEPAVSRCDDGEAPDGGWLQIAPELPDCDDESAALNHADADGDGVASCTGDCDDDPNACGDACSPALSTDGCDTYDNDCDQQVDEDPDRSWYLDADGDGSTVGGATVQCDSPGSTFRDAASAEPDCNDGDASLNTVDADEDGETTCAGDCDDDPNGCGANCNTSITVDGCGGDDNDCDTRLDEDPGTTVWYEDADGDSWVASATGIAQCLSPGATYTTRLSSLVDCDDTLASLNHDDADGDGASTCEDDCDDDPSGCGAACSPLLTTDGCDTQDNDCDDVLDEDPDIAWYGDEDDDGWALSATPLYACEADGIYTLAAVSTELDCNDTDATLNHDDVDGDTVSTCDAAPDCVDRDADLSSAATDAGLSAADIFPGATETWYDGVDQDCAGDNDFDQDGDLQVPEAYASEAGSGYTSGDCDDDPTDDQGLPASLVFVGADELCDGFDNNCDGSTDEGAPKTVFIPDSGASFVLPTPDPGGTAPATITLTEPGALRWCADDRILASVDSDNVRLLGINGRHDNEGGATWLANRTGGKVDQVNLLGGFVAGLPDRTPPLVVEAGAEVNTAVGLDLRGEATIAGSWTATNVRLLTRSDTVDPDDPSPPEGDSGRVLVDAEGQLDGSYFTAFGLDRTPFTVFGYANISWLNARNNVGGDAGVIQVGNVLNRGAIVDLESVTMVGNEGTFAGAIDIGNGSNATLTGLSYLYDNLGTSIFVGYQATFTATDAEIAGRGLREDGTVGQGSLILSRGDVTLNNCLLSAQLHADVGVHVLQGSLAVNGGSFEDTWRQGVKLEGNASSDPSTLVLNNVNMFNVPAEDVPSYFCEGYEPECRDFSRQSHVYLERSTEPYRCDCEYQSRCYPLREQYWWGDSGDELSISANCNTDTGCTSDVTPVCPL